MLRWAIPGDSLQGDVLEIGCGNGNTGSEILRESPTITLTATDIDPLMVEESRNNLPESVIVRQADATSLPFADGSFDVVVSPLMLHHVIEWELVVSEAFRVLRPGGKFIGYDLVDTVATSLLHRLDGSPYKLLSPLEFEARSNQVGFQSVETETATYGQTMRFRAIRPN
ncbi:hypothetical protein DV735_g1568, partial [Chaetothyriales sp. CBS 134920]